MQPAELRAIVAANIRREARKRRVSLTALADFAAVSRAQVFKVLAEEMSPTLDWLCRVAIALDVEPFELLKRTERR